MTERWETEQQILAALHRFESALRWQRPAAYAMGTEVAGELVWHRINVGERHLPAAVLGTVLGHRGGTAAYPMTAAELDAAIDLLAPAEACLEMDHPNLVAWRQIRDEITPDVQIWIVFVEDLAALPSDPRVAALLDHLQDASRAARA